MTTETTPVDDQLGIKAEYERVTKKKWESQFMKNKTIISRRLYEDLKWFFQGIKSSQGTSGITDAEQLLRRLKECDEK